MPGGYFTTLTDGAAGTDLKFVSVQTTATANNQTLSTFAGNLTLNGAGFTGIDFKSTSALLNGITLAGADTSDTIDLTDLSPGTAKVSDTGPAFGYNPGTGSYEQYVVTVTDGTRSATIDVDYSATLPDGHFKATMDGAGGTDVTYVVEAANSNNQTITGATSGQTLNGNNFVGIDFKGASAILNGDSLVGFNTTDTIDLSDMKLGSVKITNTATGVTSALVVTDGTHTATIDAIWSVGFSPPSGYFTATSDGSGGVDLTFAQVQTAATANGETLTSYAGNTSLNGNNYANIDFKASSAVLNGVTITGYMNSDTIDVTDLKSATATYTPGHSVDGVNFVPPVLVVSAGILSTTIDFPDYPVLSGYFTTSSDGAAGTDVTFVAVQTSATANNQTLGSFPGNTSLSGNGYTNIDFKSASAVLNGVTLLGFVGSDTIDLTDLKSSAAQVSVTSTGFFNTTMLIASDGTHSATIDISTTGSLPTGYVAVSSDGAGGTDLTYVTLNTDAYVFGNPLGGSYAVAGNWKDITTSATAFAAPSYGNAVTIGGGTSADLDITGNGGAGNLTTTGDVLLLGSITVGGPASGVSGALTQSGTLALDDGASLSAAGTLGVSGLLEVGGGSKVTANDLAFTSGFNGLLAIDGGTVAFGSETTGFSYFAQATSIGVDSVSSIEFGSAGGAAKGALTIDGGETVEVTGTIDGNVVVNGVLQVQQDAAVYGGLTIAGFGAAAPVISGSGTIAIANHVTLTLAGADSATILFQGSIGQLTLNGALPTGTISGFTSGDVINVAKMVTGLSYTQTTTTAGTLKLLNGTSTVGTLALAGSYAASQFQLQGGFGGFASSILYSPTPSTAPGAQISGNSDAYYWSNGSGGLWSNAANWTDNGVTTTTAPGALNSVYIDNTETNDAPEIISGTGAAASLYAESFVGAIFTGNLTIGGLFSTDSPGNGVALAAGAIVKAGSLSETYSLQVGGGSTLLVSGTSNFAGNSFSFSTPGYFDVISGSFVQLAGGAGLNGTIAVDSTSTVEIGGTGGAAAGLLTIDKSQTVDLNGVIDATVALNGTIQIQNSATIESFAGGVGAISGTGTIEIDSSGTLDLNAADSASIAFVTSFYVQGNGSRTLDLAGPLPTGTIIGFATGDTIEAGDVTGASFASTTGVLTLTDGATTVGTMKFAGSFTGEQFQLDVNAASGLAAITLVAASGAPGSSAVSGGTDSYSWIGTSGATWASAANWTDTTTPATTTKVPGAKDPVSISGGSGTYTVIGGSGNAASLAITHDVLLTGAVGVAGPLSIAAVGSQSGTLALEGGASVTAASATITGTLEVGGASAATVTGTATLTGGTVLALAGSTVRFAGLIGDGSSNVFAVDASSVMVIGSTAGAAKGALSVSAGTTTALTGSVYGNLIANGTIAVAAGGALSVDVTGTAEADPYSATPAITGSGVLALTEGSTLALGAADSAAISFAGPNATLAFTALPTATISGYAAGDLIEIGQTVTGLSYAQTTATTATLTLTNGAAKVGTLTLAGNYAAASNVFHLDSAVGGGTAVISLQSVGVAAAQPTLIQGTAATELLTATANGQTITGLGGSDTMNGAIFTGLDFKDLTANLNGSAIQNFATSDELDFTDMTASAASVTYTGGVLKVSDGTHAATIALGFGSTPTTGSFHVSADGGSGTLLTWH